MKVLAVDDDPSIRELLPMVLQEAGITDVVLAGSAAEALRIVGSQVALLECFLLDIQMPGGSGIDLCARIREFPEYRATPIIMLTAMHEKSFINNAFAAGATDYVTKPFEIIELSARIRIARSLVEEQRRVEELSRFVGKPDSSMASKTETDFARPTHVGGVKGLISKQAFANYLEQLSRPGLQSSTFFAVHVESARTIFDRGSSSEFEYALRHIADAAIATQTQGATIVCYIGGGNFIFCSNELNFGSTNRLEFELQGILDEKDLSYDDGSPLDIEVAVGKTVQPILSEISPMATMASLEIQSINRALVRAEEKRSAPEAAYTRRIRI